MSIQMDGAVIRRIGLLAKELGKSKKYVLENAVNCYAESVAKERNIDVFARTLGSWEREESPPETVKKIKAVMRQSQERHKK